MDESYGEELDTSVYNADRQAANAGENLKATLSATTRKEFEMMVKIISIKIKEVYCMVKKMEDMVSEKQKSQMDLIEDALKGKK